MPLHDIESCYLRRILLWSNCKGGIVQEGAFRTDRGEDGLSLTETRDEIVNEEQLSAYLTSTTPGQNPRPYEDIGRRLLLVGVAVFTVKSSEECGLVVVKDYKPDEPYGMLHVRGPSTRESEFKELRKALAAAANDSGWSRAPQFEVLP